MLRTGSLALCLLLMSGVSTLHTEVVSKLAALLECAVWVAL